MFIFRKIFVLKQPLTAGIGGLFLVLLAETALAAPGDAALGEGLFARISTVKGDIVIGLEYQKAPLTVCNFVALAEGRMTTAGGKPFFNGLTFHRVVPDFVIQSGDPLGNGRGGPGYQFPNEIDPALKHDGPGIVSMANAGPDTNGSQFFITHRAAPHLDGLHPVFGRVIEGQNVVNAIRQGDGIEKVTIIRNGPQANAFKADQAAFDVLLQNANAAKAAKLTAQRNADIAEIEKKYPNAAITASGLRYIIEKNGSGAKPALGKTVLVKYKGMFLSGKVFDNTDVSGGSMDLTIGRLIPGMNEALLDMSPGEKRTVIIPPELAYGERGAGNGAIPPNSFLVFDIEFLRVK
jgi:peptidylprolyl isomerase